MRPFLAKDKFWSCCRMLSVSVLLKRFYSKGHNTTHFCMVFSVYEVTGAASQTTWLTSDANHLVNAKRHAREKPLLGGYTEFVNTRKLCRIASPNHWLRDLTCGKLSQLCMQLMRFPWVTKVNFLPTISRHNLKKMLWELMRWSSAGKCFDQQTNSLNLFFNEMYGDLWGEFVFAYWGLKG